MIRLVSEADNRHASSVTVCDQNTVKSLRLSVPMEEDAVTNGLSIELHTAQAVLLPAVVRCWKLLQKVLLAA